MADDKNLTIDLPDEEIQKPQKEVTIETTPAPKTERTSGGEEGIEELSRQLKASKERESEARRRALADAEDARKAKEEVQKSRGEVVDSQLQAAINAIEAKNADRERLKGAFKQAAESGNYDDMAKLQDEMADIAAELHSLKRDRTGIEERIAAHDAARAPAHEGRVEAPPRRGSGDPVQDFIENMTPGKSKTWLASNRDRVDDKTLRRLGHVHEDALLDGVEFESDEYFQRLEDRLDGLTGRKKIDVEDPPQRSSAKEAASFSAPVSREAPTYTSRRQPNRITLTPAQQEAAELYGDPRDPPDVKLKKYAMELMRLRQAGDIKDS